MNLTGRGYDRQQLARIAAHQRANPHAWWEPTGAQEEFLLDLERIGGKCRDAVVFGGNATGKTALMVNTNLGLVLPQPVNPFIAASKFFAQKEGWAHCFAPGKQLNVLVILRRDTAAEVFVPELKKWAPAGSYDSWKGDKKFDYLFEFHGGGRISIFTTDQDVRQLEGRNIDVIMSDEQFDMRLYEEGIHRLRGKGCWLAFMTPLYTAGEYVDMIANLPENEKIVKVFHKETACTTHGVRGFRPHSIIAEEIRKCDPEQYAARVEGKPMHLSGKVYKQFQHNVHVIPEAQVTEMVLQGKCTIYAACDPHENRPPFIAWAAVFDDGRIIFIDEWPEWDPGILSEPLKSGNQLARNLAPRVSPYHKLRDARMTPVEFCDVVKAKETAINAKYKLPVHERFIDPRFSSRSGFEKTSLRALYRQQGINFRQAMAETSLSARHTKIRGLLAGEQDETGNYKVIPKLYFSDKLLNLIHSISSYAYVKEVKKGGYTGYAVEDVQELYKDGADVVAYLVMKNPFYVPMLNLPSEEVRKIAKKYRVGSCQGIFSGMG